MVEDVCGICGGDGTHCSITKGVFTTPGKPGIYRNIMLTFSKSKH